MREKGKAKKIKGYKEVVTYGNFPYTIPVTDARGITKEVEFVATLVETVPDHTPCDMCGVYLGNKEIEMAPHMISCKHEHCKENKMNERQEAVNRDILMLMMYRRPNFIQRLWRRWITKCIK